LRSQRLRQDPGALSRLRTRFIELVRAATQAEQAVPDLQAFGRGGDSARARRAREAVFLSLLRPAAPRKPAPPTSASSPP
jgi:hypothetical protein